MYSELQWSIRMSVELVLVPQGYVFPRMHVHLIELLVLVKIYSTLKSNYIILIIKGICIHTFIYCQVDVSAFLIQEVIGHQMKHQQQQLT